jgi:hypothetical protein
MTDVQEAVSKLQGQDVRMVQPGKRFTIDRVTSKEVTITLGSTQKQRPIELHKIERARALKRKGERLRPADVLAAGVSNINSPYVAAIVNAIDDDA